MVPVRTFYISGSSFDGLLLPPPNKKRGEEEQTSKTREKLRPAETRGAKEIGGAEVFPVTLQVRRNIIVRLVTPEDNRAPGGT